MRIINNRDPVLFIHLCTEQAMERNVIELFDNTNLAFTRQTDPYGSYTQALEDLLCGPVDKRLEFQYNSTTFPPLYFGFFAPVAPTMLVPSKQNQNHPYESLIKRKRRQRVCKTFFTSSSKSCVWCHTHSTPEWRTGPDGDTLCNACGLQYKKIKRAENSHKNKL